MSDAPPDTTVSKTEELITGKSNDADSIILISYPKIVFLYPTLLVSLFCGVWMAYTGLGEQSGQVAVCWAFMATLAINMMVISFDFPRTTSLTLFFIAVASILGGVVLMVYLPNFLPAISGWIRAVQPEANATFFFVFAAMLIVIYIAVFINVRFDYWEVRPNELLHHHGVLSDLERFSAPHLRIEKEITDVFEYALLRAGRLILHPKNEPRAIVLENVFFISKKEQAITRMLSALQVQVRDTRGG